MTELRRGVYAFLDVTKVGLGPWSLGQCALTTCGTYGRVVDHPEMVETRATEEHRIVPSADDAADRGWGVGQKVRIVDCRPVIGRATVR